MCDHFHAKYVKIKKIKEKLSMLPTGKQKLCIKIYCSVGICMIFKPTESHIDVSFKYLKWLLKILSWRTSEKDLCITFGGKK